MMNEILETLQEQGPRTIPQLALILWCEEDDLCVPVSILILNHQIHLEIDGTLWFAREVSA